MRLPGRAEIAFHTKMNLHLPLLKPSSASFGEGRRLLNFRDSQHPDVERPSFVFLARRHGELDVINS
jgi:hypothetical protein